MSAETAKPASPATPCPDRRPLSALSLPAFAGGNCQLLDDSRRAHRGRQRGSGRRGPGLRPRREGQRRRRDRGRRRDHRHRQEHDGRRILDRPRQPTAWSTRTSHLGQRRQRHRHRCRRPRRRANRLGCRRRKRSVADRQRQHRGRQPGPDPGADHHHGQDHGCRARPNATGHRDDDQSGDFAPATAQTGSIAVGSAGARQRTRQHRAGPGATTEKVSNTPRAAPPTAQQGKPDHDRGHGRATPRPSAPARAPTATAPSSSAPARAPRPRLGAGHRRFGDASVLTNVLAPATNSTVIGTGAGSQGVNNVVIGAGAQTLGDGLDAPGTIDERPRTQSADDEGSKQHGGRRGGGKHARQGYGAGLTARSLMATRPPRWAPAATRSLINSTSVGGLPRPGPRSVAPAPMRAPGGLLPLRQHGRAGLPVSQAFGGWPDIGQPDTAVGPAAGATAFYIVTGRDPTRSTSPRPGRNKRLVAVGSSPWPAASRAPRLGTTAWPTRPSRARSATTAWPGACDSIGLGDNGSATWHVDIAVGQDAERGAARARATWRSASARGWARATARRTSTTRWPSAARPKRWPRTRSRLRPQGIRGWHRRRGDGPRPPRAGGSPPPRWRRRQATGRVRGGTGCLCVRRQRLQHGGRHQRFRPWA